MGNRDLFHRGIHRRVWAEDVLGAGLIEVVNSSLCAVCIAKRLTSNKPNQRRVSGNEIELLDTYFDALMKW